MYYYVKNNFRNHTLIFERLYVIFHILSTLCTFLKMGVSYTRNPVILKFMENMRYIDRLRRGLPMVYNTAWRNNKRVIFEEFGEEFRVTLER